MVLPCIEHMEKVLHIVSHLKSHHNIETVFNPGEPKFDMDITFPREDRSDTVYWLIREEKRHNMPEIRGLGFKIVIYVDSDHAGDNFIHCSRTGFIVFLHTFPIYWTSKKQTSIETSTFGS